MRFGNDEHSMRMLVGMQTEARSRVSQSTHHREFRALVCETVCLDSSPKEVTSHFEA